MGQNDLKKLLFSEFSDLVQQLDDLQLSYDNTVDDGVATKRRILLIRELLELNDATVDTKFDLETLDAKTQNQ